ESVLGCAGRELAELELWRKYGDGRELGAGVVDVKGFNQDTPEDVARRIRRVLEVCPAEKLTVNPDCGFGWSPRYQCNQKLTALAAGPGLVREGVGGGPRGGRGGLRGAGRRRRRIDHVVGVLVGPLEGGGVDVLDLGSAQGRELLGQ